MLKDLSIIIIIMVVVRHVVITVKAAASMSRDFIRSSMELNIIIQRYFDRDYKGKFVVLVLTIDFVKYNSFHSHELC